MPLSEAALRALIRPGGESSTVEYKQSPPGPTDFAAYLAAFANGAGGRILVGVDDAGRVVGFDGPRFEEWVANVARDKVDPPLEPAVESHQLPEGHVYVVEVPAGRDKPYARVHEGRRTYFVRVGTTLREASAEELQRLFIAGGWFHADELSVRGASAGDLESEALYAFAREVHRKNLEELEPQLRRAWLTNVGYLRDPDGPATLAGVLLFAEAPERIVPESGIVLARFRGTEPLATELEDRQEFGGRLPVLVDSALSALRAALGSRTRMEEGRLVSEAEIPLPLLREALVNAVVHRDYSLKGRQVRVLVCADHVEVRSPGRPPNQLTIEQMTAGRVSLPRNPLLFQAMAHLKYVQNFGLGVKTIVEETKRLNRPAVVAVEVDETVVRFPRWETLRT